jgi:CRISPR type III-B/RAMP module-associated protein Cmr3
MTAFRFFIRPLESLFFGPPHSFSAGEAHHSRSLFPPPISAFQGFIRTAILRAVSPSLDLNDNSPSARAMRAGIVGNADRLPDMWQLHGPYPAQTTQDADEEKLIPWLPTPLILLRGANRIPLYAHWLDNAQGGISDISDVQFRPLGRPELDGMKPLGGWCSAENLLNIVKGSAEFEWKADDWKSNFPRFVKCEDQAGLALERRKERQRSVTSRHGMLYFQKRLRLETNAGFVGGLKAILPSNIEIDALNGGTDIWGRKGRPVSLEIRQEEAFCRAWHDLLSGNHLPEQVSSNSLFWLITLTPVAVDNPLDPKPRLGGNISFETLAALPGSPINLGGYDMTSGRPRENLNYLPAGSSWLFRLKGEDQTSRLRALHSLNNAFPLGSKISAAFGYGHTLVGIAPSGTDRLGEYQ